MGDDLSHHGKSHDTQGQPCHSQQPTAVRHNRHTLRRFSSKLGSGENHFDRPTPALAATDGRDLHRFLGFFREKL